MSSVEVTPRQFEIPLVEAEAKLRITTVPGSGFVAVELHPGFQRGDFPGVQYWQRFSLEQVEFLRQYLLYGVRRAMRHDGFKESEAAPIPFGSDQDHWKVVVFLSQDECKNIAEKLQAAAAIAKSLILPH